MLSKPRLSGPVTRPVVSSSRADGGAEQSLDTWVWWPVEGADQSLDTCVWWPAEGADLSVQ